MSYPITDSVLRRHYEQHLSVGGAELARVSLDEATGAAYSSTSGSQTAARDAGTYSAANDNQSHAVAGTDSRMSANNETHTAGKSSGPLGFLKILIPLVIVGLLGWFAMKFMGKDAAVENATQGEVTTGDVSAVGDQSVSYTHLTLPTNREV